MYFDGFTFTNKRCVGYSAIADPVSVVDFIERIVDNKILGPVFVHRREITAQHCICVFDIKFFYFLLDFFFLFFTLCENLTCDNQ